MPILNQYIYTVGFLKITKNETGNFLKIWNYNVRI